MRGFGGDIVVCDELAFWRPGMFNTVVQPLLSKKNVMLIAISTLLKSNPIMEDLWATKDEAGRTQYNAFSWRAICEKCAADKSVRICAHKMEEIPFWLNLDNAMGMYANDPEAFMQEILGMPSRDEGYPFFSSDIVESFGTFDAAAAPLLGRVRTLFLTIDPAQGSTTSAFTAVVSAIVSGSVYVSFFICSAAACASPAGSIRPIASTPSASNAAFISGPLIGGASSARSSRNACPRSTASSRNGRCASTSASSSVSRRAGRWRPTNPGG